MGERETFKCDVIVICSSSGTMWFLGADHSHHWGKKTSQLGPFEHFTAALNAIQLNTSICKQFSLRFSTIQQLYDG